MGGEYPADSSNDPGRDTNRSAWQPTEGGGSLLLVGHLTGRSFAVPAPAVERILPAAALVPLHGMPASVIGALNYRGALLPVVDPRPELGLAVPPLLSSQHLLVISAATRYVLRLDLVDRIVEVGPQQVDAVQGPGERVVVSLVARLGDETVPILSPDALDPGPVVRQGAGGVP